MDSHSKVENSLVEWQHTARTSLGLRLIAHFVVAGFGGLFLFIIAIILRVLPEIVFSLDLKMMLLFALLLLVGGPYSLLYLWPMVIDQDQRPSITAFSWDETTIPWTKQSFAVAAAAGGVFFGGWPLLVCPLMYCLF